MGKRIAVCNSWVFVGLNDFIVWGLLLVSSSSRTPTDLIFLLQPLLSARRWMRSTETPLMTGREAIRDLHRIVCFTASPTSATTTTTATSVSDLWGCCVSDQQQISSIFRLIHLLQNFRNSPSWWDTIAKISRPASIFVNDYIYYYSKRAIIIIIIYHIIATVILKQHCSKYLCPDI